jgi:myosin heavy subunit
MRTYLGKYLELVFDARGVLIVGAQIQTYLLEKSRVTSQVRTYSLLTCADVC